MSRWPLVTQPGAKEWERDFEFPVGHRTVVAGFVNTQTLRADNGHIVYASGLPHTDLRQMTGRWIQCAVVAASASLLMGCAGSAPQRWFRLPGHRPVEANRRDSP